MSQSSAAGDTFDNPASVVSTTLPVGRDPVSTVAADVNGDGKLDLVCANVEDSTLTALASGTSVASTNLAASTTNLLLTVLPASQPPGFAFAANSLVVAENPGVGVVAYINFLTRMTPGAGNPPGLRWTFSVFTATNSGSTNVTFAQFPTLTTNGVLTFRTKDYFFGTNTVNVVMTDTGGITNGGVIACTNSFQLQVTQSYNQPLITGLTNRIFWENAKTNLGLPFTLFDQQTTTFDYSGNQGA